MIDLPYLRLPIKKEALKQAYLSAPPFPHLVLDHFLSETSDLLEHLYDLFPPPSAAWWKYDNPLERKLARDDLENFPPAHQSLIQTLMSRPFVQFLEQITGIEGLITDHHLNGGGLHQIARGGKLDIHADYNYHPLLKLDRRVNVLFYLNPGWRPEWRGDLELWDEKMTRCVRSIAPLFNRMVIFSTTDTSYHGHPHPLQCPEGVTRKSIALYYYTNGRPEHEKSDPHSTLYQKRPEDPIDRDLDELRKKRAVRRLT